MKNGMNSSSFKICEYQWRTILSFLIFLGLLSSCGITHEVSVQTIEPAIVDLTSEINRIGIINESIVADNEEASSELEAWVSYSDRQLSEAAKEAALSGLFDELVKDARFDTIVLLQATKGDLIGATDQLEEIPWQAMKSLCENHELDALFALAFHETNTQISLKKTKLEQRDMLRDNIMIRGHEITLETLIENGWRIYDPFNKLILDEITLDNHIVNKAKGEDPLQAFQAIDSRKDSVIVFSKKTGNSFGLRLQPQTRTVSREYFYKGSVNLEKADALVQSEEWKAAADLWELDMSHPEPKIRGRSYFNMAVINELHGDLETAMDWAKKSNQTYGTKLTEEYLDILSNQLLKQQQIEEQYLQSVAK